MLNIEAFKIIFYGEPPFIPLNLTHKVTVEAPIRKFGILIHGGAGNDAKVKRSSKRSNDITRSLKLSICRGYDFLRKNTEHTSPAMALDAVETAVVICGRQWRF
ncbi:hypothetical protein BH18THE2_BH18THE2_32660 [soil metagenome]